MYIALLTTTRFLVSQGGARASAVPPYVAHRRVADAHRLRADYHHGDHALARRKLPHAALALLRVLLRGGHVGRPAHAGHRGRHPDDVYWISAARRWPDHGAGPRQHEARRCQGGLSIRLHLYLYISVYTSKSVSIYVDLYLSIYPSIYLSLSIYLSSLSLYIHTHTHIYIYISTYYRRLRAQSSAERRWR